MGFSIASRTSCPTSLGFSSAAVPSSSAEGCLRLLYPIVGLLVLGLESGGWSFRLSLAVVPNYGFVLKLPVMGRPFSLECRSNVPYGHFGDDF